MLKCSTKTAPLGLSLFPLNARTIRNLTNSSSVFNDLFSLIFKDLISKLVIGGSASRKENYCLLMY